MAQVSKYPMHKDVEKRMLEVFNSTIANLRENSDINDFLQEFLSPVEKLMLAKRLSIAVLLAKGYSYPSIQSILRVTPSTIAQVSLSLKYSGKGYKKIVEKILQDEKVSAFWEKVEDMLSNIPASKGSDWTYAKSKYHKEKYLKKKAF
jgi:uncharacterized protein YerC